jgi:hypothetical protein
MQIKVLAIALGAAGLLSACAGAYGGGSLADAGSDAWYDGYYGAYTGGYWGPQGIFNYGDTQHGFHRDMAGHFHHNPGPGLAHVRGPGVTEPHMASR